MIEFNIKKILVPVDFGTASINALDSAIGIAKRHDAAILLLNVIETGLFPDFNHDEAAAGDAVSAVIQNAERELQFLQDSIIERFLVPCEAVAVTGFVSSAIIKTSVTYQADMIVMGTHGASNGPALSVGSNAYDVVQNAVCPVLTIPSEKKYESFKKILFPVRAMPSALEKYEVVRKIIRKSDATLKILGLANDYEADVDFLKDLSVQLHEKLKEDEIKSSAYFKVGKNMAEEVLKIAALMQADLIVITATNDSSFGQFYVGPYTQFIIDHSGFPVLSVKPVGKMAYAEEGAAHDSSFTQKIPLYN